MNTRAKRDDLSALKPAGVVFAAVVAGLGAGKSEAPKEAGPHAPLEPASQSNTYFVDPTNHPGFEEDPSLVFGASDPVPVLGGVAEDQQTDLFKR